MRVLVTGGAGYIGSVLVPRLLERGVDVRVVDRLYFGATSLDAVRDRIELVHADIREPRDQWFDGVDAVIHLAGLSNDPTANFDAEANWEMNAVATSNLADACMRNGVRRFVFGSSCSLYDGLPDGRTYNEDSPIAPRGPYAESKRYGEEALLERTGRDFIPVILRQGTVFGPSPRMRFDLVVNTFVKDAILNRQLLLHGGGWMWRPLVDVRDAADAQIACALAQDEAVCGQIFNVVQDNYQISALAEYVAEFVGISLGQVAIRHAPEPALVRNYRCDNSKLEGALGFKPVHSLRDTVAELVEHFSDLDAGRLLHPRHYNLEWLVLLRDVQASLKPFDYVLRRDEAMVRSE